MYKGLGNALGYNLMYSQRGQLTLAHTDASLRTFRLRAEVNKHPGVRSEMVDVAGIRELVLFLNLSRTVRYPVLGGLWHQDGGLARHDTVARALLPPAYCHAVPWRDSSAWLRVSGKQAGQLFANLCEVDLLPDRFPNLTLAQTSIARMNSIVIRDGPGTLTAPRLCVCGTVCEMPGRSSISH